MLLHEDSHTTQDNTHSKICLLCIFPVHFILWSHCLGKLKIQQKSIHNIKENYSIKEEGVKKCVSCGELQKFNTPPVAREGLFTLPTFTVDNIETLQSNSETYCVTPGHKQRSKCGTCQPHQLPEKGVLSRTIVYNALFTPSFKKHGIKHISGTTEIFQHTPTLQNLFKLKTRK